MHSFFTLDSSQDEHYSQSIPVFAEPTASLFVSPLETDAWPTISTGHAAQAPPVMLYPSRHSFLVVRLCTYDAHLSLSFKKNQTLLASHAAKKSYMPVLLAYCHHHIRFSILISPHQTTQCGGVPSCTQLPPSRAECYNTHHLILLLSFNRLAIYMSKWYGDAHFARRMIEVVAGMWAGVGIGTQKASDPCADRARRPG